jgi:light-regulated signal transduction histidine kinase (bacteriophytochrome)
MREDAAAALNPDHDPAARAELERANKDLDALNYAISHDLRSPLRTMEEMARIMLEEHARHLPPDTSVFLKHFAHGAAKLGERVDGLARYGRVSRQALTNQRVDVAGLVRAIVAELRANAGGREIEVIVNELPDAMGDPMLIRQVFASVLTNAFKYTRHLQHSRIEIGATQQDRRIAYFVSDNGAGFDMKYAGKLFSLFQRLHGDSEFEGSGVELALARRIVERHGGAIRAEGRKDHGATFHFTLPAAGGAPA